MGVFMKNGFYSLLCVFTLIFSDSSIFAFDFNKVFDLNQWKKSYDSWWLIKPLQDAIQEKQNNAKCSDLANPQIRDTMLENNYQAPQWVKWFSFISPQESLFDYAFDIYQIIQNILNVVFNQVDTIRNNPGLAEESKQILLDIYLKKGALESILQLVLASQNRNIEVDQKDIEKNTKSAIKLLNNLIDALNIVAPKAEVPSAGTLRPEMLKSKMGKEEVRVHSIMLGHKKELSQSVEEYQAATLRLQNSKNNVIDKAGNAINKLQSLLNRPRLSVIERKHRNYQLKWMSDYVHQYCNTNK